MASAEHEPIMGVWGQNPQRGPGAEAESILVIGCPTEPANLAPVRENSMLWCQSWGPRVHGAPKPVIWGELCSPAPPPMVSAALGLGPTPAMQIRWPAIGWGWGA